MGWTNQVVQLVIIQAGGTFTGLFLYSPAVGAGNLKASIAAAAGTDPYGNSYQPGITAEGDDGSFVQLWNAGAAIINLQPTNEPGADFEPGQIDAVSFGGTDTQAQLALSSPNDNNVPNDAAAALFLTNRGTTGTSTAELDADVIELDGIVYLGGGVPPSIEASSIQTDSGTVTSTTYTAARTGTTNVAGCSFVAPPSGKVGFWWHAGVSNSSTTAFTLISIQVRTGAVVGSGTIVVAATDNVTIQHSGTTAEESKATFYPLDAGQLTGGTTYNVQLMYRVSASTGTINRPRVMALPIGG